MKVKIAYCVIIIMLVSILIVAPIYFLGIDGYIEFMAILLSAFVLSIIITYCINIIISQD